MPFALLDSLSVRHVEVASDVLHEGTIWLPRQRLFLVSNDLTPSQIEQAIDRFLPTLWHEIDWE